MASVGNDKPNNVFLNENYCTKTFLEESDLQVNRSQKYHECYVSDKSFTAEGTLSEHMLGCNTCGEIFTQEVLQKPMQSHGGKIRYACEICDKTFARKSSLVDHLRVHTGEKPYVCDVCGKSCSRKQFLQLHMRVHAGEKPHVCDICNKKYATLRSLRLHMPLHIPENAEKPHVCHICQKAFTLKWNLKTHMHTHRAKKPHVCIICGKTFGTKYTLQVHMRIHTGEKPYECDTCYKSYRSHGSLRQHKCKHFKPKPEIKIRELDHVSIIYSCDICDKSLKRSVKKHMERHMVGNFYVCNKCNTLFSEKADLRTHLQTSKGEKSSPCDRCSKSFLYRCALEVHSLAHATKKQQVQYVPIRRKTDYEKKNLQIVFLPP